MTRISMKDPFVLQLYKIRNVKKYDEFLELLEEVLNEAAERIYSSLNKNSVVSTFKDLCESAEKNIKDVDELKKHIVLLQKKLEDDISCRIVDHLDAKGFVSSHDPNNKGHVDILVQNQSKKFKWIGEAKLYDGNRYHQKGLYQLINDYSSGGKFESGGVLIYLNKTQYSVKDEMQSWDAHLKELAKDPNNRLVNFDSKFDEDTSSIFYSQHTHHRSGDPYRIRHCCLDIRIDF
ncbi:hypothetical protein ACG93T_15520 [Acinetobacter beijerinckii]|uniref:hypothetical protein n=1 Tax=Acinetobacter beijerinckii TaxID=262668 RepID=UPI003AF7E168